MNMFATTGRWAAGLATIAMIVSPRVLFAQAPLTSTPADVTSAANSTASTVTAAFNVTDIALDARNGLNGQALTPQGTPLAGETVVLDDGASQITTATDAAGRFRIDNLRGGAYRVQVAGQTQFCRAWRAGTAPPAANDGLMVVPGAPTVLGQYCGSPVGCGTPVGAGFAGFREAMRNPLVVGGVIAAAIAIPVALHNSNDDEPAS